MNKLWEFWIRVYQRTLGGQEKPSRRRSRTSRPLSIFPLSGGGCRYTKARKNPTKNPQKGGKKNMGNLGPNQAQNSTTLSTTS